jgi:hypothetical protein
MRNSLVSARAVVLSSVASGLVASAAPQTAAADVQSSSPAGFVVRLEVPILAAPADVYAKLFEIGRWWSDAHTYTGKASNMTLKNEPGGCFCETLPDGFVRHAAVEYSDKGKVVRLSGALGPLQELGAQGMLSFNFAPAADKAGTRLTVSYAVSGYPAGEKGLAALAGPVNDVLKEQIDRFKRYVETGKPGQ